LVIKSKEEIIETLSITDYPKVIELEDFHLDTGLFLTVPEFNYNDIFDRHKKLSSCKILDHSIVQHINNFDRTKLLENLPITTDLLTEINSDKQEPKEFYELSLENQTDKVYYHGYHYFYPSYFEKFRFTKFKLVEIGYGNGSSMKTWIEYFPNADITVMDINIELKQSERCRVIKGDQSKINELNKLISIVKSAKLIIDDGSHNPIHQFETFNFLFQNLLEPGGVYIIEDIELSYWNPESTLYGYKSGYLNIVDAFKKYLEMINSEFTGQKNHLDISTIEFAQNCIIITKRSVEEKQYFERNYRFSQCINDICHYGQPEKIELNYNFDVFEESLHDIGKKLKTDKAEHLFTVIYESKFQHLRNKNLKFLEIGLWLGSSIRMWREYFKNAEVYGADLFSESEMKEHVQNINKTQNLNLEVNWGNDFNFIKLNQEKKTELLKLDNDFDIIVEDGGHTMYQQQISLSILIDKLKSGGYYIIEDVHTSQLVNNYSASTQIYGADENNNTLRLLKDLKTKKMSSDKYFINENEFTNILNKIEEIEIIKTQRDSIVCIIKKM
jgi:hypothetical protein